MARDEKTRERDRLRKAAYRASKRGQPPVSQPVPPVLEHPARAKKSPEREKAICDSLEVGNTRRASCVGAGISEDTFARWMAADESFSGRVKEAEAKAEQRFLGHVSAAALTTWQAAAWWLERRKHEDFGRRDRMDMARELHREGSRMAKENGLEESKVMAEVEAILAGHEPE